MPYYDFRCRTCGERFEERRSMAEADRPATCPAGHAGATRLLPVVASVVRGGSSPSPAPAAPRVGGGCCGGACGCR